MIQKLDDSEIAMGIDSRPMSRILSACWRNFQVWQIFHCAIMKIAVTIQQKCHLWFWRIVHWPIHWVTQDMSTHSETIQKSIQWPESFKKSAIKEFMNSFIQNAWVGIFHWVFHSMNTVLENSFIQQGFQLKAMNSLKNALFNSSWKKDNSNIQTLNDLLICNKNSLMKAWFWDFAQKVCKCKWQQQLLWELIQNSVNHTSDSFENQSIGCFFGVAHSFDFLP